MVLLLAVGVATGGAAGADATGAEPLTLAEAGAVGGAIGTMPTALVLTSVLS